MKSLLLDTVAAFVLAPTAIFLLIVAIPVITTAGVIAAVEWSSNRLLSK